MNQTRISRNQDIEMSIKIYLMKGDISRAIDICLKYNVPSKRFGQLAKEVGVIRG